MHGAAGGCAACQTMRVLTKSESSRRAVSGEAVRRPDDPIESLLLALMTCRDNGQLPVSRARTRLRLLERSGWAGLRVRSPQNEQLPPPAADSGLQSRSVTVPIPESGWRCRLVLAVMLRWHNESDLARLRPAASPSCAVKMQNLIDFYLAVGTFGSVICSKT